ncbi:hypothetical protein BC937DRAFT_93999 [Endogone sp. FLAS-F59071]|nr:hypothetical protein BC937DRAFT_93999 [Endogone sp. FLAS-F59071]|eukprot:RUS14325.1 hypothetical protein BC937DRAFT_93999 [Endogone sp. FLAS-F59071]
MDSPMTATRASSDSIPVAVSPLMPPSQWPQNFSAMDLDPSANPWWFGDLNTSGQEMLPEPGPFEDFKFSFGLDPNFAIPLPIDIPPPPFTDPLLTADMPMPSSALPSPSLGNSMSNNPLLDENDQRAFSQFLDGFFLEQDFTFDPQLPNNLPTLYSNLDLQERRSSLGSLNSSSWDHQPKRRRSESNMAALDQGSIPISTPSSMMMMPAQTNMDAFHYNQARAVPQQATAATVAAAVSQQQQQQGPPVPVLHNVPAKRKSQSEQSTTATESDDRAAPRKTASVPSPSTTRPPTQASSLSQTKSATTVAPSSSSPSMTTTQPIQVPNIKTEPSSSSMTQNTADEGGSDEDDDEGMSPSSGNGTSTTKRKPYKELLTEEEKRANHIQSEQKRRNTIRAGFRDLTDLVPTLKNVNNSKSTILFKAVEYIRYLERRNRGLRDKVGGLEMRVEVEGRSNHGGAGGAGNGGNGNSMGGPGGSAGSHRRGAGGGGNGGGANGGAGGLGSSKRAMSLVGSAGAAGGYYNMRHQHLNGTIAGMVGKAYPHHSHVHYASAQPQLPGGGYQQIRYNSDAAAVMVAAAAAQAQAQAQAVAQAAAAGAGRAPSPLHAAQSNELHLLYSSQQYPHGQHQQHQQHQQLVQSQYTESTTSLTIPVDNEEDDEEDDDDESKAEIDSGYSESGDRELGNAAALRQSIPRNIAVTGKVKKSASSVMMMMGDGTGAGRDLNMGMAAVSS